MTWPQWKLNLVRDFKAGIAIKTLGNKYKEGCWEIDDRVSESIVVEQIIRDYMIEFTEGKK